MRIVLSGEGTRGDLQPLIELAERAAAAGHSAVVCGPPDFLELAAARGVDYRPLGPSARAFFTEHAAIMRRNPVLVIREAIAYLREQIAGKLAGLIEIAEGADLLLAGGAEVSAASAAERLAIPYRYLCYCPVLLPSREHAPAFVNRDSRSPLLNRLLWPIAMTPIDMAVRRILDPARRSVGLGSERSPYRTMIGDRPVLLADAILARVPSDVSMTVEQVPAVHPLDGEALPEKLAAFLDAGPPPVFVGFGSMPDSDPAATSRLVLAAAERLGVRVILSAGWAQLGGVPLPESVIEIGPVTHPLLFPRCAAVVHHGGAGTTTNALRSGVPQVVVPHLADQFYWGRRVSELGIGVVTGRKHRVALDDLVAPLAAVLDNEMLHERASELGARALSAAREADPIGTLIPTGPPNRP